MASPPHPGRLTAALELPGQTGCPGLGRPGPGLRGLQARQAAVAHPRKEGPAASIRFGYSAARARIVNNGHTIQVICPLPVEISKAQLRAFRKLYASNARPMQPLNGRIVETN